MVRKRLGEDLVKDIKSGDYSKIHLSTYYTIEAVNLTMLAITNILAYNLVLMGPSRTLNRK